MKVVICVLNWNGEKYISSCLDSIKKLIHTGCDLDVVVIDNDSSDGSVRLIQSLYPQFTFIRHPVNLGYAQGNNTGLRFGLEHGANFVWVVNPDVQVEPNSLQHLLEGASKYRHVGIFGSKIYFTPGYEFHKERYTPADIGKVIWYAGGLIDWGNLIASHRGVNEVDRGQFERDIEIDFVTGASMLIRREVLEQVGLLDPKYFLYYEENDLCQRAKRQGWKLMYICQSLAWHANAQATGTGSDLTDYFTTRNRMLFGLRYAPNRTKIALITESLRLLKSGRPWQRAGLKDFYLSRFGTGSYEIK